MNKLKYTTSVMFLFIITGLSVFISEMDIGESLEAKSILHNPSTINGKLHINSTKVNDNWYYDVHTFNGKAGEKITIEMMSQDFDTYIHLYDFNNNKIAEDDNSGSDTNSKIIVTLPTTGIYRIYAWTRKAGESGKYSLSLRATSKEDMELAQAEQLNQQGFQFYTQGKYNQATPLLLQALAIRTKILGKDNLDVAESLNELGVIYYKQESFSEAESYFKQALETRIKILGNNHLDVAEIENNLGLLYKDQGRLSQAEPLLLKALNLRQEKLDGNHIYIAITSSNLALLYIAQGRYQEAEPLVLQAIKISENIKNESSLAINLNVLGFLYENQGKYEKAEQPWLRSLEIRKRLLGENHPDVAKVFNNLGSLYLRQKNYRRAEEYFSQALKISKPILGEHPSIATSLGNLAHLYDILGRYQDAEEHHQQALAMRKRLLGERHPVIGENLLALARFYWMRERNSEALKFHKQALDIEEYYLNLNLVGGFERQKRDYLETFFASTNDAISVHLNASSNNPEASRLAFNTIVNRKGRILDVMTNNLQILRQRTNDKDSLKLIDEISNIYTQLASRIYNKQTLPIADLEEKLKLKEDELSRRSAEFANLSKPINLEDIQKLIPADTSLVEIVKYRPWYPKNRVISKITFNGNPLRIPELDYDAPRYAAYVLTSTGEPQGIDLGEAKEIEKLLELFRNSLRGKGEPSTSIPQLKESARDLDKLVMQPIRKLLGNKRKILISPDASLNLIPFEALVDENNRYLVENYSFTYLTSGRDLLRLQNQYPSKQPPVIMADPFFDKQGEVVAIKPNNTRSIDLSKIKFPPLNGTKKEAEAISQLLGVKPLLGTQASEAVIKQLKSPELLLIATHGFFENAPKTTENQNTYQDNPLLLSGLVLAGFKNNQGGGNQDGILTALETTSLNLLGTKLVVLSACDTGLGKDTTGEGIYGLRRALVIAGSESQVISLWKVADDATKDLMIAYFKKVLGKNEKKQGRSEALRQVQLEMLRGEKYQHPYYWAAFIPSGDWREIP